MTLRVIHLLPSILAALVHGLQLRLVVLQSELLQDESAHPWDEVLVGFGGQMRGQGLLNIGRLRNVHLLLQLLLRLLLALPQGDLLLPAHRHLRCRFRLHSLSLLLTLGAVLLLLLIINLPGLLLGAIFDGILVL